MPFLALSATLSHSLEAKLIAILDLQKPVIFRSDLNRANIEIKILPKPRNPLQSISILIRDKFPRKSGIIYCSSRTKTEKTAEEL